MQILYAIGIMALSVFTLESLITSKAQTAQNEATYRLQNESIKTTWQLTNAARQAYEISVRNPAACPAGTTTFTPSGTTNIRLCWRNSFINNNCLRNMTSSIGQAICLRANGNGLASLFTSTAYAAQPAHSGVSYALMSPVFNNNPVPNGGGPANGANVILPGPNIGGNINSNHINCNTNYTECFSVIYCIDGTTNCPANLAIIQTFATRVYW